MPTMKPDHYTIVVKVIRVNVPDKGNPVNDLQRGQRGFTQSTDQPKAESKVATEIASFNIRAAELPKALGKAISHLELVDEEDDV